MTPNKQEYNNYLRQQYDNTINALNINALNNIYGRQTIYP